MGADAMGGDLSEAPANGPRLCGNCSGRGRECVRSKRPHLLHKTLPGDKLERRHVLVSVVQQLKHLLRMRSLNFVDASSVYAIWYGCDWGGGAW